MLETALLEVMEFWVVRSHAGPWEKVAHWEGVEIEILAKELEAWDHLQLEAVVTEDGGIDAKQSVNKRE
jgi:hypothetical protein